MKTKRCISFTGFTKKPKKKKELPVGTWWDKQGRMHLPEKIECVKIKTFFATPKAKDEKAISFWQEFDKCEDAASKLSLLRKYAETVNFKREKRELRKMRHGFNASKHAIALWGSCGACGDPSDVRHHIVQLQNGGRNKRNNIMLLCNGCHAEIHPWLKVAESLSADVGVSGRPTKNIKGLATVAVSQR